MPDPGSVIGVGASLLGGAKDKPAGTGVIPGGSVIPRQQAAGYVGQAADLSTAPISPEIMQLLTGLLTSPQFAPQTSAENNLVNQAYSGRQATFNALGTGASPASQTATAAAAAVPLAQFAQQRIGNLMQMIQVALQQRGLSLEGLLGAAKFGDPKTGAQGAQPFFGSSPFAPLDAQKSGSSITDIGRSFGMGGGF